MQVKPIQLHGCTSAFGSFSLVKMTLNMVITGIITTVKWSLTVAHVDG